MHDGGPSSTKAQDCTQIHAYDLSGFEPQSPSKQILTIAKYQAIAMQELEAQMRAFGSGTYLGADLDQGMH